MQMIKATIENIDDQIAILKVDHETMTLPVKFLPAKYNMGDIIYITISKNKLTHITSPQMQKDILNEIFSADNKNI